MPRIELARRKDILILFQQGFMLHQMNRKDVNETFQVRSALETYCTVQISKASSTRKAKKLFKRARLDHGVHERYYGNYTFYQRIFRI